MVKRHLVPVSIRKRSLKKYQYEDTLFMSLLWLFTPSLWRRSLINRQNPSIHITPPLSNRGITPSSRRIPRKLEETDGPLHENLIHPLYPPYRNPIASLLPLLPVLDDLTRLYGTVSRTPVHRKNLTTYVDYSSCL